MMDRKMVDYYSARAAEYERVYDKPERQADLAILREIVPQYFRGRRVLDVACGTGYWTRLIAREAAVVTGCDLSGEVLALAYQRQPAAHPARFLLSDAFDLGAVPGAFGSAFVGFFWSHILRADVQRFLKGLHARLAGPARVMIIDNRYVQGSNSPITRVDDEGNTYQERRLENGSKHEVLKNFPSVDDVVAQIEAAGGHDVHMNELEHYWCATYAAS